MLLIVEGDRANIEVLFDRFSTIGIYIFGFLVIGYQWWRHHQVFDRIERADTWLILINFVMLACIAFMPYPTSVLGESQVRVAALLYVVPCSCRAWR
ncbi:MAG: TMEM175 family protein [Acidimicrobiales bacterium]